MGGIYFGERKTYEEDGLERHDVEKYNEEEVEKAKIAFESAMKRNKKVTSVDKANV